MLIAVTAKNISYLKELLKYMSWVKEAVVGLNDGKEVKNKTAWWFYEGPYRKRPIGNVESSYI